MKTHNLKTKNLERRQSVIAMFSGVMLLLNSVAIGTFLPLKASAIADLGIGPACVTVCGNGSIESGEQCDDGNTVSKDGCSSSCQNECLLELTKTDSPDPVAPGGTLNYHLSFKNVGTADCTGGGVELKDTFDLLTSYVSASITPTATTSTYLSWNFGVMAPGADKEIDLTMTVATTTACDALLTNRAKYFSNETGWSPEAIATTTVACPNVCGDGKKADTEECDDGLANGDVCTPAYGGSCSYCSDNCTIVNLHGPYCGDGVVNDGEACEGPATQSCPAGGGYVGAQTCTQCQWSGCVPQESCGDNIINDGEQCDGTATTREHYSCTGQCTWEYIPYCGDGTKNVGEECDGTDGVVPGQTCTANCTLTGLSFCGDGKLDNGEFCDDGTGNTTTCAPAYGGSCSYCDLTCKPITILGPYCGDNIKNGTEECDGQSGIVPGQSCTANCTISQELCRVNFDVVFVMDRSGSMGYDTPTRLSQAKNAADTFVDRLGADDQSGLVSYSNTATLDKALSNNHSSTKTAIDNLVAGGATNIGDGIALGNGQFAANGDAQAVKIEILLTDGMANKPNGPGTGEFPADVAYAQAKALEAAAAGIKIYTIGLGLGVNENMLKQIASSTHGEYHYAPTANDLDSIFSEIAFDVCQYGSIGGCKYNDTNNDGNISGEPKLPGWKINLTGTATTSQQTDSEGCYLFNGLEPGSYIISEDQNQSTVYVQTYPTISAYTFTLARGENKTDADFGNYLPNCGNSIIDQGTNETCDNGQSNGIACTPAYGSSCNYCSASCQEITLTGPYCGDAVKNGAEQCDSIDGVTIGYRCSAQCTLEQIPSETGSIKACKYEDLDGNASSTTDRLPLAAWNISVANGVATTTQATDQTGCTTFSNLPVGQYSVSEAIQTGWYALESQSGFTDISVVANQQAQVNFNNSRLSSISGYELHDLDGLASTTGDRSPLSGWIIKLLAGSATGTEIATTSSAINGYYIFDNLLPGAYGLAQILLPGWLNLELPQALINLVSGTSSPNNNFVNSFSATTTPQKDLAVTKAVNSTAPNAGDTLIYTIVVYNHGTATATNVTATDTLPVDLTFVSATSTSGSYASSTWNIPELAIGASTTLIITATVNQGTAGKTITNTVVVAEPGVTDPTPADNTASATSVVKTPVCTINCGGGGGGGSTPFYLLQTSTGNSTTPVINTPSLLISKKADKTNVFAGTKKIGYSITITNNGLATANDVLITDTLPAGLVYTDSSTTVKSWNVGTLGAGEIRTFTYLVDVLLAAPTDVYANTAVATATNASSVSAKAELNVRAPEILGVKELPSTGFDLGEAFMLLIALAAAVLISRWARYVKSTLK